VSAALRSGQRGHASQAHGGRRCLANCMGKSDYKLKRKANGSYKLRRKRRSWISQRLPTVVGSTPTPNCFGGVYLVSRPTFTSDFRAASVEPACHHDVPSHQGSYRRFLITTHSPYFKSDDKVEPRRPTGQAWPVA
jgi:hypothetical protein